MTVDAQVSLKWLLAREQEAYELRERRRQAARDALRAAVSSVAPSYAQVGRAFLFGSVTRPGGLGADSDLDVAVEGMLSAEEIFALWRDLEHAADSGPIDLVELDQRDVHFAQRIRETGELIYERKTPDSPGGHPGRLAGD
jgi:predicted nucleotidyltransferase